MGRELRGSSLRGKKWREEANPMENVGNIVDAILVFACGLMVALIVNGGLQVDMEKVDLKETQELTEVPEAERMVEQMQNQTNSYEKMGILYKDDKTGKMYMLSQ